MTEDTIAAISTPLGEGGIGIVRLSGKDAVSIADKIFFSPKGRNLGNSGSQRITYGFIKEPLTGATIDEVLVTVMKAPHSYTKEDVVEINCHGGVLPLRKVLELTMRYGARPAEPGEFTRRAFLNGRLDLAQAEAVIDVIRARTDEAGRMALRQLSGGLSEKITALRDRITALCANTEAFIDFPEDDIDTASKKDMIEEIEASRKELLLLSASFEEGRFFREGIGVAIVGRPNVGKSSLLNALLRRDRAIVTDSPGTTRDVLEEYLNIKGLPVRVMDTAGIRQTHEMAEREGVLRSIRAIEDADLVIGVIDGSAPLNSQDMEVLERIKGKRSLIAINKSDLPPASGDAETIIEKYSENVLRISARTESGLEDLKDRIVDLSIGRTGNSGTESPFSENNSVIITNVRHKVAIDRSADSLARAADTLLSGQPIEITAIEMREALDCLGEIVGAVTTEDILERIFSQFCIGK